VRGRSDDGKSGGSASDKGPAAQGQPPDRLKKFPVPGGYDASSGWQQTLNGLTDNAGSVPATLTAKPDALAYMLAGSDGYVIQSRALDSGRLRWSSKKWNPPAPMQGAAGDPDTGQEAEIPDVETVTDRGREYVIAWAHGMKSKDELHDGQEVVQLSVFPADATDDALVPERSITVPVDVPMSDDLEVRDGGEGVLVTWGEQAAAVNIRNGTVKRYQHPDELLEQCDDRLCYDSKVRAVTSAGPVVGTSGDEAFGVPGRWFNEDHAPKGMKSGELLSAEDSHLLASWEADDDDWFGSGSSKRVFAVHNSETGAVEASTTCSEDGYSGDKNIWEEGSTPPLSLSPNGRYLVAGSLAFDLKKKRGICLTGDGNRKTLLLVSVRDDGTAYGATESDDDEQATGVAVSLASGRTKALPDGTRVPIDTGEKAGAFMTQGEADEIAVAIVHER